MSNSANVMGVVGYMTHVYHANPGWQSIGAPQGDPVRAAQHPDQRSVSRDISVGERPCLRDRN